MSKHILFLFIITLLYACNEAPVYKTDQIEFEETVEEFDDIKILRYQVADFDNLEPQEKELAYYLTQAGLAGRDILWDINYKHNLKIRHTIENIIRKYTGDKTTKEWEALMTYAKKMWLFTGIHNTYTYEKISPNFSRQYFNKVLKNCQLSLPENIIEVIFNPDIAPLKINKDIETGLVKNSAINFYGDDITAEEVSDFYNQQRDSTDKTPISYGLNSTLIKNEKGEIEEKIWHLNGLYGEAIEQIIYWLNKAKTVALSEEQAQRLELLIQYYTTGDLKLWDEHNVLWVTSKNERVDLNNGFIEAYLDPKGIKGAYENLVTINNFVATQQSEIITEYAQWFEDNAPIMDAHKKDNVVGISYEVRSVVNAMGYNSPFIPIGVNLPNSDWIKADYGSKSYSLGNVINAYRNGAGRGILSEFAFDSEEIARKQESGVAPSNLETLLHEVIGHASGKLEPGVDQPSKMLKNYYSALEEARADLFALYYMMDPKLVEIGLLESTEQSYPVYDGFIRHGLLTSLRNVKEGQKIRTPHLQATHLIATWAYEKGLEKNVIEKVTRLDKVYFKIKDYPALRVIFGELLKEVQRIKSQGDYLAAQNLVENYGAAVDPVLRNQVVSRYTALNAPFYLANINPYLIATTDKDGRVKEVEIKYPDSFTQQMLHYGEHYSFLPVK